MKIFYKLLLILGALASIFLVSSAFAQSCPMCKESMTQAGEKLSNGFYYSILEMAFLPFGLVAGGAIFVLKSSYQKNHPDSNLSTIGIIREVIRNRFSK